MTDVEVQQRLADLREKVLKNEEIPASEFAEIIDQLREGRKASARSSSKGKKKVDEALAALPADLNDLFKPQDTGGKND